MIQGETRIKYLSLKKKQNNYNILTIKKKFLKKFFSNVGHGSLISSG